MSRVHDALRKAERSGTPSAGGAATSVATPASPDPTTLHGLLEQIGEVDWDPAEEGHLIDAEKPNQAPTEEFRSLRTRVNHLQGLQPLHTLVVTSPSPAEGKTFTAANLAVVQSHLQHNLTLLADFDFRRPTLHNLFKIDRSPGVTEYLQGKASLPEIIKRVKGTNLYLMPAGGAVLNPLELLNLKEVRVLLERLPTVFNWVILDTPPLLFAADANLLATMTDGTLLVVRLSQTTIDTVTRAIQGMSHNNVIGVVANGASRSELYSKYSYYQSYYYGKDDEGEGEGLQAETEDAVVEEKQDQR
ncbi:MAG: CpsD/CapB family tyrosine-protein kinase [Acidimicrobiia bacterium]|nr:CpsD/CapB family tyrosine-protein kinase [Acidimicrobiia bacterium]